MSRKTNPFDFTKYPNPSEDNIRDYLLSEYINKGFNFRKFNLAEPKLYSLIEQYTSFLNNVDTKQRIHTIVYGRPSCKLCNNHARWNDNQYGIYCSNKCRNNDKDYKEKIIAEKTKNFGENYNEVILNKSRATMLEKYGMENYVSTDEFKDKSKATLLEKYGVDNYSKTEEFKENNKAAMYDKYGVDNYSKTEEFKARYNETSLNRYGVSHPMKTESIKRKVVETTNQRYSVDHYNQINITKENLKSLQDLDWLKEQHHDNKKTLQSIARLLEVHDTTVKRYIDKYDIDQKYYFKSDEQQEIEQFIQSLGLDIKSNDKILIYPNELDIVIKDKKIAIEYCGLYWHSELYKETDYHKNKLVKSKEKGYKLITIFQDEWLYNKLLVKNKLKYIFGLNTNKPVYARKTKICYVDVQAKKNFFEKHHIQGNGPSSINYGLEYNNELVAVIGFIKNKDGSFILNRYATSHNVVGGFTKLLAHFEREYNKPKIITFADLRWSEGHLYYNSGFIMDKELKPDYRYIIKDKTYHKFNFRHNNLSKKIIQYDFKLSEHQNILNNKIYRIYDCGKLRFIKNI